MDFVQISTVCTTPRGQLGRVVRRGGQYSGLGTRRHRKRTPRKKTNFRGGLGGKRLGVKTHKFDSP